MPSRRTALAVAVTLWCLSCQAAELSKDGLAGQGPHHRSRQLQAQHTDYVAEALQRYLSNSELAAHLKDYTARCPHVAKLASIGKSVEGLDLWVLELGDRSPVDVDRPAFRYLANMHGDEPTGRQLLLALAEWLCLAKGHDSQADRVLSSMSLHLLLSMNPDGFAAKARNNRADKDLNRDFPDPMLRGHANLAAGGQEQPETLAVMAWAASTAFTASAQLHEGAVVANYPWDGSQDKQTRYSRSPDDATFVHLARTYANAHGSMHASKEFPQGITNGAAWYPLWGGLQDWSYVAMSCMELTLELSEQKWPPESQLPALWADNKPALLALPLMALFGGLRGWVLASADEQAGAQQMPLAAVVSVQGVNSSVRASSHHGTYYRPLAPGSYTVTAALDGYEAAEALVTVPVSGKGVVHNFTLQPLLVPGAVDSAKAADSAKTANRGKVQEPHARRHLPNRLGMSEHVAGEDAANTQRQKTLWLWVWPLLLLIAGLVLVAVLRKSRTATASSRAARA